MQQRFKDRYVPVNMNLFKKQALAWACQFDHLHLFSDNGYSYPFGGFANRLFAGCAQVCPIEPGNTFAAVQQFHDKHKDWLVGYLSYDLKNEIEHLQSKNPDHLQFPGAYFYIPQHLIHFEATQVLIETTDTPEEIYRQITAQVVPGAIIIPLPAIVLQQRISEQRYLRDVEAIKHHILEGDVYELNYCMEYFAENVSIDPKAIYDRLNSMSPMPFSLYGRTKELHLICASPERFLRKTGSQLLSQPIKGTARRGNSKEEDEKIIYQLRHNEKELAENMMIVDLVRNDLARSARPGSVKVEEMFGIYTFRQLHQMISSVSALMRPELPFMEAIKNAFPMGSMTGAPKIKAMELIDHYEQTYRGPYSGAAGYITPEGDFDFNVVIRTIVYNAGNKYLSFEVGSAITYDAQARQEYEECLLKASVMRSVLTGITR
jgi:para-aminobenzoate synthetase component 1